MKQLKTILVVFALSMLVSCVDKPESYGDGSQVYVIADTKTWTALEDTLRAAFERTIRTPQPEKIIEIYHVPPKKFGEFARRKNLVILGVLDSEGEISQKVAGMLAADVKAKVEDGSAFVFPKENPWADNQNLMVLAGNSETELAQKLLQNRDYLYNYFYGRLIKETKKQMFSRMEQTDLSKELMEKYGWTMRIQHDYFINTDRADLNFVMLRRSLPGRERWLFVHWVEDADPSMITEEWVLNTRDRFTKEFYKDDRVNRNEKYLEFKDTEFGEWQAFMVEGLWENENVMAGGPFRNYSFYDEATRRVYMIDCAVYFPGGPKVPFLLQLEIMAKTLKTDTMNKSESGS